MARSAGTWLAIAIFALGACGDAAQRSADAGSSCPAGEGLCGGECVTLDSDGECPLECDPGLLACGGACVDPQLDPEYCGASGDCAGANSGEICEAPAGTTAVCRQGTCGVEARASCLELRDSGITESGVYSVRSPGGELLQVYCDMESDGGGWTLVMKLSTNSNQLTFSAPQWTTEALFNESSLSPNVDVESSGEAKLAAFNVVAGTELRLSWIDPEHSFVFDGLGDRPALALFQGEEIRLAGGEGCAGEAFSEVPDYLPTHMRHGKGAQFYGINGTDEGNQLRFGFASNDESNNPWRGRQGIGEEEYAILWKAHDDCNDCGCYGTTYDAPSTAANLWVR